MLAGWQDDYNHKRPHDSPGQLNPPANSPYEVSNRSSEVGKLQL